MDSAISIGSVPQNIMFYKFGNKMFATTKHIFGRLKIMLRLIFNAILNADDQKQVCKKCTTFELIWIDKNA